MRINQRNLARVALVCGLLVLAGCQKSPDPLPAPVPKPPGLDEVWTDFDKFEEQLMKRARKVIGDSDDYRIFVTTLDFPIGTLLRMDQVIQITECTLKKEPTAAPAPNMFPDYKLSKNLAISVGLDKSVLTQLADLGASLKDSDSFNYQIKNPEVKVLSDTQLKEMLSNKDCLDAMAGKQVRLIRGRIYGQRDFSIGTAMTGQLKAGVTKIGSFDVSGGVGNSDISIKDSASTGFLQVISVVTPPPPGNQVPDAPVSAASASAPASQVFSASGGKVFVQQDKGDPVDAQAVVADLGKTFTVAKTIEKIDTKMPKDPQVRYFNETDRGKAEQITAELKVKGYATAEPVRLGLPAPVGQVEVWLPKNTSAARP